ncbi:MAG: hypothetical protein BMS9Abin04_096 [Planctomycetia bacterium]|nr:MAG: hypothetical protein BMS9Abin04_096 [Planctomycetia bacterium]
MKTRKSFLGVLLLVVALARWVEAEVPHVQIGRFPQEVATIYTVAQGLPADDVRGVHLSVAGEVWADTAAGWAVLRQQAWQQAAAPPADRLVGQINPERYAAIAGMVRQAALTPDDRVVAATSKGLLIQAGDGFKRLVVDDGLGRRWGTADVRGVALDSAGQLWFTTLAGAACRTDQGWKFYTGRDGLPYNDFTCVEAGPNGVVWFGTHRGAVRFDGNEWAYRQGRRWLPHDDIRGIAADKSGNVWFATAGGVGLIERRMMTLAEKAEFYEDEMERYIRRTPFGYVSEVGLARPGDKSEIIYRDSDNDGLWTAMYGAGECFAYGATSDPKAKARAKRAFEALRFLQKVPLGSAHSPPKGFVARSIRPADWPDPNAGRLERDRRNRAERDALWKVYEPRWPKSADGKWYWKSDTSSDELDGHYFFYPLYYDLVADTAAEKERVREVVRDLTDHLIQHGYNLIDHDGTPTRWGYYSPEALNHDPNWWVERGLKSLSMLSYLAVAEHVTGDPAYGRHLEELVRDHAYDTNAMIYKIHRGIGSGNQSDDEMAFMCYYNLVKYAKDEALRKKILYSFFSAWANEQPEMNPFFNFAYAAVGLKAQHTDDEGTYSVAPWSGWLEDAMATLKGFSLDRVNWACQNSHRLDLVLLPRQQAVQLKEPPRSRYGYRVNGKVLPVENRHFGHWNTNPWVLDYGGSGRELASGTVFLLPYYMGLYHGFIEEIE